MGPPAREEVAARQDRLVQQTDTDAAVSRVSAVNAGYLNDPFAQEFMIDGPMKRLPIINRGEIFLLSFKGVKSCYALMDDLHGSGFRRTSGAILSFLLSSPILLSCDVLPALRGPLPRRLSILHRCYFATFFYSKANIMTVGTYVRTTALDKFIEAFMQANPGDKQIISLGAGTDTRYFRLRAARKHTKLLYHEIDFPKISANKLAAIRSSKILSPELSSFYVLHDVKPEIQPETDRWGFLRNHRAEEGYLFHPIDLRHMDEDAVPDGVLPHLPTLLISECCLCYLDVEQARRVIRTFTKAIPTIGIAIYEPVNPTSDFGRVMFQNLASRNLKMPTVHTYTSLQSQRDRLKDAGFWQMQDAATILWIWQNWIAKGEKERIDALEMLDELEEWELLAEHYTIAWGYREGDKNMLGAFARWDELCPGPTSSLQSPLVSESSEGTQPTGEDFDDGIEFRE